MTHAMVRFYRDRITRGYYWNRDHPDPLNQYLVVWVEGHGWRGEIWTADLVRLEEVIAMQDQLEEKLREYAANRV